MNELTVVPQDYMPIVYDCNNNCIINKIEDEEIVNKLLCNLEEQLISLMNLKEGDYKYVEKEIIKFYFKRFDGNGQIPNGEQLFDDIVDHNTNLCYQMADIDFANNFNEDYSEEIDEGDDIDEVRGNVADYWCEYMNYHFENIGECIELVLNNHKLTYYHHPRSKAYNSFKYMSQIKIVHNDCQNLINPEFLTEPLNDILGQYVSNMERVRLVMEI